MSRGKQKAGGYKILDKKKRKYRTSAEGYIKIKPLSVNNCWQGRRFKTKSYKEYEEYLFSLLDNSFYLKDTGYYQVYYEFGQSSTACDWDNPTKPFQDILARMYLFNDRQIMKGTVVKKIVPKGEEYIKYKIFKYKGDIT